MRKVLLGVMIALCLLPLASACASQALVDMLVYDEEDITGITLEALQIQDGMLLVGASDYMDSGWLAFYDQKGKQRWSYLGEQSDIFCCLSPLAGGGFSALRKRSVEETDEMGAYEASDLVFFNKKGKVVDEIPLMKYTQWLLADADGYYAMGLYLVTEPIGDGEEEAMQAMRPHLSRLDSKGFPTWSLEYTHPDYTDMTFYKGVMADDSIIIMGDAYNIKNQAYVGMLYRVDRNGNVIWTNEAALGADSFINDICETGDGLIAGIYTNIVYDQEEGGPIDRMCSVFLMNMEGETLWEYSLENGKMLDYILPVQGGLLCGSQGVDLDNCPFIGDGWLLLLGLDGKVKAEGSTPEIGGGKIELYGMSKNMGGEALLCGTLLDEPGYSGAPFMARLDFPEAYR